MSLKALKPLICVFSVAILAATALCSELSDFRDRASACKTVAEFQRALDSAPDAIKQDSNYNFYLHMPVEQRVGKLRDESPDSYTSWTDVRDWLVEQVDAQILLEQTQARGEGKVRDARAESEKILSSPLYSDPSRKQSRNWINKAGVRLGQRLADLLSRLFGGMSGPNINVGEGWLRGLTFVAWAAIVLVIAAILFFVVKTFSKVSRKRRVGGILEDDEPDRTADQWLEHAEQLAAEGRYREGVRCLYLACLVRYDDGKVARFRRYETNWEHLYRIEASPNRPTDIDFRGVTQRFDKIWYGNMTKGEPDYIEFKEVYTRLCEALRAKEAA